MKSFDITDRTELVNIINSVKVCYVGLSDNDMPYVIPFNFGYKNNCIYLHSGKGGRKLSVMKNNNNVCITFSSMHAMNIFNEEVACSYSMKYKSVMVFGIAEFVENYDEKIEGMNVIMQQYTGRNFEFSKPSIDNVDIIRIDIEKITGKNRGYE